VEGKIVIEQSNVTVRWTSVVVFWRQTRCGWVCSLASFVWCLLSSFLCVSQNDEATLSPTSPQLQLETTIQVSLFCYSVCVFSGFQY